MHILLWGCVFVWVCAHVCVVLRLKDLDKLVYLLWSFPLGIHFWVLVLPAISWEGLGARGEGDDRGWDGWMAKTPNGGWHHWLDGRESQRTPGVGDGQGGLACCDSWGRKESDTTERLIWSDLNHHSSFQQWLQNGNNLILSLIPHLLSEIRLYKLLGYIEVVWIEKCMILFLPFFLYHYTATCFTFWYISIHCHYYCDFLLM